MLEEAALISFLRKFDQYPFCVKHRDQEYRIGEGEPVFSVRLRRPLSLSALTASTSLALGEAYMDGDLEIEGDLYDALDHFLGQMDKFAKGCDGAEKADLHILFQEESKAGGAEPLRHRQ